MIGLALNILSFIFVAGFIIFIGIGALYLLAVIFDSSDRIDSKYKGLLQPVRKILGISEGETIPLDTSEDKLNEAVEAYYKILEKVFESETPEQRKAVLSSDSPSGKLSNAFYAMSGLNKSLGTLTKDISYVVGGSGWKEYRKLLKESIGGNLKSLKDDKYKLIFNKNLYLLVESYSGIGYSYGSDKEWRVEAHYKNKRVLSCYPSGSNYTAHTFKPDVWILYILKAADKYSKSLQEMKLREATERRKQELFE